MAFNPNLLKAAIAAQNKYGVPADLLVATALQESGGRLDAVGDGGTSFGPYQFHRGGRLTSAGFSPQQAMDPNLSTMKTAEEFAHFMKKGYKGGALAAAAQRPASPGAYAANVDRLLAQARKLLGGRGMSAPAAPAVAAQGATGGDPSNPLGLDMGLLAQRSPGQSFTSAVAAQLAAKKLQGGDAAASAAVTPGAPAGTARAASQIAAQLGGRVLKGGKLIGTPYGGTHTLGNWQSDNAIDVRTPAGTPIYAAFDGTVGSNIGSLGRGGRFAGLRMTLQGMKNALYYAHLSRLNVKAGQRVKKGQIIGWSGSANGVPHLHLGSQSGDPRSYYR